MCRSQFARCHVIARRRSKLAVVAYALAHQSNLKTQICSRGRRLVPRQDSPSFLSDFCSAPQVLTRIRFLGLFPVDVLSPRTSCSIRSPARRALPLDPSATAHFSCARLGQASISCRHRTFLYFIHTSNIAFRGVGQSFAIPGCPTRLSRLPLSTCLLRILLFAFAGSIRYVAQLCVCRLEHHYLVGTSVMPCDRKGMSFAARRNATLLSYSSYLPTERSIPLHRAYCNPLFSYLRLQPVVCVNRLLALAIG